MSNDWEDKSIEQPDIVAAQDPKFNKNLEKYNVSNPHPLFGKDPTILNEFGHTTYPKMIYPNGKENAGIVVKNETEEAKYHKQIELSKGGPTIKQYVDAGFNANTYPPEGYLAVSTKEEIQSYLDKEKNKLSWN